MRRPSRRLAPGVRYSALKKGPQGPENVNITTIMQTCPCNEDPLTPHFYIVKLGCTGVYILFLIFALKHRLWVPTINVLSKNKKNIIFFHLKINIFTAVKYCMGVFA